MSAATVARVLAIYTVLLISEVDQDKCDTEELLSGGCGGCETMGTAKEDDAEEAEWCGAYVSASVEVFFGAEEEEEVNSREVLYVLLSGSSGGVDDVDTDKNVERDG